MQAQLSSACVESILNTLNNIKPSQKVIVHYYQKSSRSHGGCIHSNTFGPPAHEAISVVDQNQGISSKGQAPEEYKGYTPGAL